MPVSVWCSMYHVILSILSLLYGDLEVDGAKTEIDQHLTKNNHVV